MKETLTTYKKRMDSTLNSVRRFNTSIEFLTSAISRAEINIPQLEKQLVTLKEKLPEWIAELKIQKLSLTGHLKSLTKQRRKFELAEKISKARRTLLTLNKEINRLR